MKKLLFFTGLTLLLLPAPEASAATVAVLRAEGPVNPVMAEYVTGHVDRAAREGDGLLVVELDTPGGLDSSMRLIVKKLLSAPLPVAVFVSPAGARAASAGVFITLAAHVAAMAPGTNIGAAHPVNLGGGKMDETMAEKVVNDASAYIRSIAEKRGRNAEWAEGTVRESLSASAEEALEKGVVNLVVPDVESLVRNLDGREVELPSGPVTLATRGAVIVRHEMPLRLRILGVITNPNIAYLLMLAGILGLYIEITNPGTVFPGVLGAVCLVLSFYALQTLPVNYAGVLLIVLAMVMFLLELKVPSFGMLTVGAVISLLAGSLMLFDSPDPFLRVSLWVMLPSVAVFSTFFALVAWFVVRAHRAKVITGREGMLGLEGTALSDIDPTGQVSIHGEIWQAEAEDPIHAGEAVVAVGVEGLRLRVRRKDAVA